MNADERINPPMTDEREKRIANRISFICDTISSNAQTFCGDANSNFLAPSESLDAGDIKGDATDQQWAEHYLKQMLETPFEYGLEEPIPNTKKRFLCFWGKGYKKKGYQQVGEEWFKENGIDDQLLIKIHGLSVGGKVRANEPAEFIVVRLQDVEQFSEKRELELGTQARRDINTPQ